MHDLIPVLALGIIVVSGLSLMVAIPRPQDAMTRVREFSGRTTATDTEDSTEAEPLEEPAVPQQQAAPWGNLDFTLFGEEEPSP